jgi:hypothetical protein
MSADKGKTSPRRHGENRKKTTTDHSDEIASSEEQGGLPRINADRRGSGGLKPQFLKRPGGMDKVFDAQ